MVDNEGDYEPVEPLDSVIRFCSQTLTPLYVSYDRSAIKKQKNHITISKLFIASGTIAVIAVTIQLINKSLDIPDIFNWPGIAVEVIVTVFALVAVIGGIISSFLRRWLLDRHKAERIRLLKFRYLIDPRIWEGSESFVREANQYLENSLEKIRRLGFQDIDYWVMNISIPEPAKSALDSCKKDSVLALVRYYRKKRVDYQKSYYCRKMNDLMKLDRKTEKIPLLFFFVGVIAVLGHFLIDLFAGESLYLGILSVILAGLAITLPFLGVAVRSIRLSFEVSRGVILFRAKYTALSSLDMRLESLVSQTETDCDEIIKTLWECEDFLEAEHREWLLLVENAESLI